MNERILDLAEQADIEVAHMKSDHPRTDQEIKQQWVEQFAHIIVWECAAIYHRINSGNLHLGTSDYIEALNKTFFEEDE